MEYLKSGKKLSGNFIIEAFLATFQSLHVYRHLIGSRNAHLGAIKVMNQKCIF